jgi:hypothetical protein
MQIECLGRRSIEIEKKGKNVCIIIWWKKKKKLATLELEKSQIIKLVVQLLYGLISTDTSKERDVLSKDN